MILVCQPYVNVSCSSETSQILSLVLFQQSLYLIHRIFYLLVFVFLLALQSICFYIYDILLTENISTPTAGIARNVRYSGALLRPKKRWAQAGSNAHALKDAVTSRLLWTKLAQRDSKQHAVRTSSLQ